MKLVLMNQLNDFGRSIVSHQEVNVESLQYLKQMLVIDLIVRIKATTGALSPRSVRGINEHCRPLATSVKQRFYQKHPVRFTEFDPVGMS